MYISLFSNYYLGSHVMYRERYYTALLMITRNSGWVICYEISDQEYIEIITRVDRRLCVYVIWQKNNWKLIFLIQLRTLIFVKDVRNDNPRFVYKLTVVVSRNFAIFQEIPDVRRMIQTENSRFEVSSAFYEGKQIVAD